MDEFFRCAAAAVIGVILVLALRGRNAEIALVLSLTCCVVIALSAVKMLSPVKDLLDKLQAMGEVDHEMIQILLKVVGIGLLGELAAAICTDSGNGAIGKSLQIMATAAILYLSLPLFTAVLELLERILGGL